jgi:SAM-dependent methyltransferase
VTNEKIDVGRIHESLTPPPLFERGAPMWHDPYIATQMLAFHLDDSHDIASRRPALIDGIVGWLTERLDLRAGMRLLDLGCGPGLYTRRFAGQGLQTVGVDYSQNSIDYARSQDPATAYHCLDYREMDFFNIGSFDVVTMIYGDLCVLSDEERDALLGKVRRMLRPGGHFVCDVTQPRAHHYLDGYNRWSVALGGGFWRPGPHLVLEQGFTYPDDISLQQYIVIELDGTQTIYRNWFHDYTPETIRAVFAAAGFEKIALYADLMGSPLTDESAWCGVVAGSSR